MAWHLRLAMIKRLNFQCEDNNYQEAVNCDTGPGSASICDFSFTTIGGTSIQKSPRMSDDSCRLPSGVGTCMHVAALGSVESIDFRNSNIFHLDRFLHSSLDLHARTSYTVISNTHYAAHHHLASRDGGESGRLNDANRSR
jgi:hypothetical protein